MALDLNRRRFVLGAHMTVLTVTASPLLAQSRSVWSAENAFDALLSDTARIIDVRTHEECWTDLRHWRTLRIAASSVKTSWLLGLRRYLGRDVGIRRRAWLDRIELADRSGGCRPERVAPRVDLTCEESIGSVVLKA